MNQFKNEKEFERFYYSLTDHKEQIEKLAEWRNFQIGVVSKFIDLIRQNASEQYTNLDHFLLELLQNADDNDYKKGVEPTINLKLTQENLILYNNEVGFKPENLFAITYAAASTKTRKKCAGTFIGEKGIGFKSIFAVADYVDIHSEQYHFRLKNDEYIIPYFINPKDVDGTEIIVQFRKGNEVIPKILSKRLNSLCDDDTQEFTLFLQKIENLNIQNLISATDCKIITFRDKEKGTCVVESQGIKRSFITFSYKETIPSDIVTERFKDFHEDLDREIVFAVPCPIKSNNEISRNGIVFCFLPTKVKTGTPIHIQVDAKTITNRDNIVDFNSSKWNKTIFQNISKEMTKLYVKLTKLNAFKECLPEYWPCLEEKDNFNNDAVRSLIIETMELLKDEPVILDQHDNFKPAFFVKRIPKEFTNYFYEDKYEKALSKCIYNGVNEKHDFSGHIPDETFSIVSKNWAYKYSDPLETIGVKEIGYELCLEMLKKGVPSTLDINDDKSVRNFLDIVMTFACANKNKYVHNPFRKAIEVLKECPIYPLRMGDKKQWGSLTQDIMQLKTDSPTPEGNFTSIIIDPLYTYNPGGNIKGGDESRDFNEKFRKFLYKVMDIRVFTLSEFLRITDIRQLKEASENPNDPNERIEIEKKWSNLHNKIWNRKKTTIKEHDEHYWNELIQEIGDCKILVWMPLTKEWELEKVSLAFLHNKINKSDDIEKEYSETNAPVINLDLLNITKKKGKSKKKKNKHIKNIESWTLFLQECGAKTGPYLCKHDLSNNDAYKYSSNSVYSNDDNLFAKNIRSSIDSHDEFRNKNESSYWLVKGSNTYTIDKYTKILLSNGEKTDFVAKKLSAQWNEIENLKTNLKFKYGRVNNPRLTSSNKILLYEEIRSGLILQTDKGFQKSSECFEDNNFNKKILEELGKYVNPDKAGYNKGLLQVIGVKEKVSLADISDLIIRWYQRTSREQRSSKTFAPFLEVIDRFFSSSKDVFNSENATLLQLYSEQEDALLPYNEWKASISPDDYSQNIIQNLENNLNENLCKLADFAKEMGISEDDLTFIQRNPDVLSYLKDNPKELDEVRARAERKEQLPTFPENKVINPERRIKNVCERLLKSPLVLTETKKRDIRPTDLEKHSMLSNAYTEKSDNKMFCQICKNVMPFKMRNGKYYFEAVGAFSEPSIEHEAQYLALCPLCAAMYKEFIKRDDNAMREFKSKLNDLEELEIPISLGDLETTVQFVETHFIDIKQFLREDSKRKSDSLEA